MLIKIKNILSFTIFLGCYLTGLALGLGIYDITNYIVELKTFEYKEIYPLIYLLIVTMIGCSTIGIYFGVKLSLTFHKNVSEKEDKKQDNE